jgi:hypothetical protein
VARVVEGDAGISRRVPWELFSDGRVWELLEGQDFDQDAEHARRAVMAWAYRRGVKVRTSVPSPDRLRVQFQK